LTTATLGDHLAAQGMETNELYSRGARVRKGDTAVEPTDPNGPGQKLGDWVLPTGVRDVSAGEPRVLCVGPREWLIVSDDTRWLICVLIKRRAAEHPLSVVEWSRAVAALSLQGAASRPRDPMRDSGGFSESVKGVEVEAKTT